MKLDPLRRVGNRRVPLVRGVCRHRDCLALHQNQTQQKPCNGTVPSVAELCAPFVFRTRGCVAAGQVLQPLTSSSVRCPVGSRDTNQGLSSKLPGWVLLTCLLPPRHGSRRLTSPALLRRQPTGRTGRRCCKARKKCSALRDLDVKGRSVAGRRDLAREQRSGRQELPEPVVPPPSAQATADG